ncbi:MAG: nucleotidyltransferase family protein [Acidimicrobiales bacterium]
MPCSSPSVTTARRRATAVAAVVLAAGGSARFQGATHKLLVPFRGKPLALWAIEAALQASLDETVVVSGAVDLAEIVPGGVTLIRNDHWQQGLSGSLAGAVRWCEYQQYDGVVVGLADQPLVPASAWIRVASAAALPCARPVVAAVYRQMRRNPVYLDRSVWPLLPTSGDAGARTLMVRHPELVAELDCDGDPSDIDTIEDLDRLSAPHSQLRP